MIWLAWRQARLQMAVALAAACAIAAVAALTGPRLADLARSSANLFDQLSGTDRTLFFAGIAVVALAPAIIGAFWGAPLVAREVETGTYRLIWTQSVPRSAWLAARIGITSLAAAGVMGAISLAVTWWSSPLDGAVSGTRGALPTHLTPVTFAMRGVVPVGYAVFAVALGTALGAVLRKTLPAMAITLALYAVVQIAMPLWVRPTLITPVTTTISFSRSTLDGISLDSSQDPTVTVHTADRNDWILSNETVDAEEHVAGLPGWFKSCLPPVQPAAAGTIRPDEFALDACLARLTDAGYRQRVVYQPADRFWPLQWAETAAYLAASAVLVGFTFWWVRRRIT
jgi:ABC-2 family transporter protein